MCDLGWNFGLHMTHNNTDLFRIVRERDFFNAFIKYRLEFSMQDNKGK